MRKIIMGIGSVLLALAAAAAVILPACRELESARRTESRAAQLTQLLETMDPALARKHRNLAMWYNLAIRSGTYAAETREAYGGILDLGNQAMGVLEIPGLGLALPIYHGGGEPRQDFTHRPESSLPVGGLGNHTVLEIEDAYAGRSLEKLEVGELIRIRVPGIVLSYRVESVARLPGDTTQVPAPEQGKDLCTLVIRREGEEIHLRCARGEGDSRAAEHVGSPEKSAVLASAAAAAGAGMMPWILAGAVGRRGGDRRKTASRRR